MRLYHVSYDLRFDGDFTPRLPKLKKQSKENREIPRICFSTRLDGCFSALPKADDFETYNLEQRGMYRVYEIETDDYAISSECIVTTEELDQKGYVLDAHLTDEVWVTCPLQVKEEDSYVIILEDYCEGEADYMPYRVRKLAETPKYDGDVYSAYFKLYPKKTTVPTVAEISELSYVSSKDAFPLTVTLRTENPEDSDDMQEDELDYMRCLIKDYEELGATEEREEFGDLVVTFAHAKGFEKFCEKRQRYNVFW